MSLTILAERLNKIDPKLRIAGVLALIWLVNLVWRFSWPAVFKPLIAVSLVAVLDLGIGYWRNCRYYLPVASFVTGLLIGLIISPDEPVLAFVTASILAVVSKQFVKMGPRHIFNPAAFGIFGASVILATPVSWWAVAWSKLLILPIIGVSYTLFQLKRLWQPFLFLIALYFYLSIRLSPGQAFDLVLDGSIFLFAFIMLTEPMTSPSAGFLKSLWAPQIVVLIFLLSFLGKLEEPFLPALLLANLTLALKRLKEAGFKN